MLTNLGVAVDLGTTTICAALMDLKNNKELGQAGCLNSQVIFGEDVITRINFCLSGKPYREKLRETALADINGLIQDLLKTGQKQNIDIREIVIVGNTAMLHFLLGLDVACLVKPPYRPQVYGLFLPAAKDLSLAAGPRAEVKILPAIGGFVGSDILAGLIALNLPRPGKTDLMADIGTNGEIVLCRDKKIIAVSCAAGPAFEGRHIKHGMRAVAGAIERVDKIKNRLRLTTISNQNPQGICGSGLIDALALLLRSGAMEKSGRLKNKEFILCRDKKKNIAITQEDVRQLQLAKSALRVGMEILLKANRLAAKDIDRVYLCGVFGSRINIDCARQIGLLPDVAEKKINFYGNTALQGAKLILGSKTLFERACFLARVCRHFNLARHKTFPELFTRHLSF